MSKRMEELVEILNKMAYEYYVLDNPTMADSEYDKLYDELKKLEEKENLVLKNSPTKRIGGEPISAFKKHTHINKLYSLDKCLTFEELKSFEERLKKIYNKEIEYTVEYKYDGLTICLTYENGEFVRATTRGNGEVGEDVTSQVLTIKTFPLKIKYQGVLEVQGEAVIKLSTLKEYNETATEVLKNPRNAVAGAIRNLDPKETQKRKPEILFYNVNYTSTGELKSQMEIFEFLKENGFKTFNFLHLVKGIDKVFDVIKIIEVERKNIDYLTDGAVIKVNDFALRQEVGFTQKFPKWAMAYKFEAEEVTTILKDVIWQVGRTGKLTPLGIVEPVELAGATVKKATLNNYGDILRKKVKINSRVLIRRSNEVIPEILGATEFYDNSKNVDKPTICPFCKQNLIEDGANLFCVNENCVPRIIGSLTNFASKDCMNIDGFSEMTATQLYNELGVDKYSKLYELKKADLIILEGFKDKKADNLISSIENSKNVEYSNFIFALGIDGVGKKTAKDIAKNFKTIEELENAKYDSLILVQDVGEVIAKSIENYFNDKKNIEEINKLFELGVKIKYQDLSNKQGVFSNEKVVLTGSLENFKRSEASKIIENLGGEIMSSVSKLTTLVIAGSEAGSKKEKAEKLGVKIITESEFMALINN